MHMSGVEPGRSHIEEMCQGCVAGSYARAAAGIQGAVEAGRSHCHGSQVATPTCIRHDLGCFGPQLQKVADIDHINIITKHRI